MSAFSTSETRLPYLPTTSHACLTTAMHSSQSPSMVVNIESVRFGRPDSRTTFTACATASETDPVGSAPDSSPTPDGAIENAMSIRLPYRRSTQRLPAGACDCTSQLVAGHRGSAGDVQL